MKHLLSSEEGRALDLATLRLFRLESSTLIEKASLRLWDALKTEAPFVRGKATRIVALCGKGGNGDDALAVLRHAFSAGYENLAALVASAKVQVQGGDQAPLARGQAESLASAGVEVRSWDSLTRGEAEGLLSDADLVLDGILGTGASGSPRGEAAEMIDALSRLSRLEKRPTIAAVDIPSGLNEAWAEDGSCVRADLCLALEPLKKAHFLPAGRTLCGRLKTVSDVFPESLLAADSEAELLEESDLASLQPRLDPTAYKMRRGRLAIFAGSKGTAGAARLCAKAAAASGAGYLTLYVDEEILPVMAKELESVIVKPIDAWRSVDPTGGRTCDAILAGPGWGRGEGRKALLESLAGEGIPLVLDADALRLAAEEPGIIRKARGAVVMTPHPGEFATLAGARGRGSEEFSLNLLEEVGNRYGALVVYKTHVTWIRGPGGRLAAWDGMDPGLGTSGSGDVLAGLVAGLAASAMACQPGQAGGMDRENEGAALFDAARCAVVAHGTAGRILGREKGWFEASDLAPTCAKILRETRRPASGGV
jgi:ADP-dependent NAD(P)H-hydrate dehydratase / NAD(P)H-hydrate epimerase